MTTNSTAVGKLLQRWLTYPPQPPTRDEVADFLCREYRAYLIPLDALDDDNFEADEDIRSTFVDSLFTVTHPLVLRGLTGASVTAGDVLIEEWVSDRAEIEDARWRHLLHTDREALPRRFLDTQHALGQRVSIVLECEDEVVTGFKVFGMAGVDLRRRLRALVGYPLRGPQDPPCGNDMVAGDLADPRFVHYLHLAAEHGVI